MTVGLALIVRDEARTLPGLLRSIHGAFDQVVLVDTGSEDRTREVFTAWAEGQDLPLGYRVEDFDWCDDFAAARNYADSLLTTDWLCWADADDVIHGADRLRQIAADVPHAINAIIFDYHHRQPYDDNRQRERLVRRGVARWIGRLHETRMPDGVPPHGVAVTSEVCHWEHRDGAHADDERHARNMRILLTWVSTEPTNRRARQLLVAEASQAA